MIHTFTLGHIRHGCYTVEVDNLILNRMRVYVVNVCELLRFLLRAPLLLSHANCAP